LNAVEQAKKLGQEFLWQDETGFHRYSIQKKTYSAFCTTIVVDQNELMQSNITAVAAVSATRGLVHLKLQDKGVNEYTFQDYIKGLSNKM
jgi:hypothetical protein